VKPAVDTDGWRPIGRSANADFYEVEPHVLAVVPFDGCTDDEETARQSIETQLNHLREHRTRAGVVVFMDPVAEQTAGARTVYRDLPDPAFHVCFALVGGTGFGRAVASFFIGLSPPKVPTRMFASFDEAIEWIRKTVGA
jgi:hypothetical protein